MVDVATPGSNVTSTSGSGGEAEWQFLQCFGERTEGEDIQDADIISAVEFDDSGQFLATGDRGGRVVIFERGGASPQPSPPMDERPGQKAAGRLAHLEYRYLTEFQSHEPEFDYLKSLEIEEKINQVQWVPHHTDSQLILSTNDKTVKLWKVYDKQVTSLAEFNVRESWAIPAGAAANVTITPSKASKLAAKTESALKYPLRFPKVVSRETTPQAKCSRVFANAHAYHINSISVCSDRQTFLSADDLRINLWHLDVSSCSFNVLDIKPPSLEDLTEVITCAAFHPHMSHALGYSSSKGGVKLCDLRASALCDQSGKSFAGLHSQVERNFFSEITSSVSHMKFSRDGRYILTRDYMSLKLWDLNMENQPVTTVNVHENLRGRLCELYDNDCIFDKFNCCMSSDGGQLATGTYSNLFRVVRKAGEWPQSSETLLEASRDPLRRRMQFPKASNRFSLSRGSAMKRGAALGAGVDGDPSVQDFSAKLVHLAWHPEEQVVAAAASNSLYLYCQR